MARSWSNENRSLCRWSHAILSDHIRNFRSRSLNYLKGNLASYSSSKESTNSLDELLELAQENNLEVISNENGLKLISLDGFEVAIFLTNKDGVTSSLSTQLYYKVELLKGKNYLEAKKALASVKEKLVSIFAYGGCSGKFIK